MDNPSAAANVYALSTFLPSYLRGSRINVRSRGQIASRLAVREDALGGCRTRWRPTSASQRWRMPSPDTAARIFNTDQGSQFTSFTFTTTLEDAGVRISMDCRGRWMDNVFIERLWRTLKYECVFLNVFETGSEARSGIGRWIGYYNASRPHFRSAAGRPTRSMLSKASRRNWRRNQTQNPP